MELHNTRFQIAFSAAASRRSSLTTAASASGLMPFSHSAMRMAKLSLSSPQSSSLDISKATACGAKLKCARCHSTDALLENNTSELGLLLECDTRETTLHVCRRGIGWGTHYQGSPWPGARPPCPSLSSLNNDFKQ